MVYGLEIASNALIEGWRSCGEVGVDFFSLCVWWLPEVGGCHNISGLGGCDNQGFDLVPVVPVDEEFPAC